MGPPACDGGCPVNARAHAPWLTTLLVATAAFVGVWGLEALVERGAWLRTTLMVLGVTTLAVLITRLLSRSRNLPTLVGVIVAIVSLVPAFAVTADGAGRMLPTPGALLDLGRAFSAGIHQAATSPPPLLPASGMVALITAGVLALFLVADYVAVAWKAPALAGVFLLGPWLPAALFQYQVSITALVAAITLWLTTMALTHEWATPGHRPSLRTAALGTAVTTAVALLTAPLVLGGPGWGVIPRVGASPGHDGSTRLNVAVDLRNSLTTRSTTPVMRYASSGAPPSALRLYTLTHFDGSRWDRKESTDQRQSAAGEVLWPVEIDDWESREHTRLDVHVLDLEELHLPLPPTPRAIEVVGQWLYDAELDELVSAGASIANTHYTVDAAVDVPELEDLLAVPVGPQDGDALLDASYVHVASAIDSDRISSLAQEITAGATTRHSQVLALQSYFRSPTDFTYDPSVQVSGSDAISTFLDEREGYCIHFASAMVIMARTLDIPARMGLGFLPGDPTANGTYVIAGGDAHVWPEIWFPEQGWVRFEPTPAIQSGPPPPYADPLIVDLPAVDDDGSATTPTPTADEAPSPTATEQPAVPETADGVPGSDVPTASDASSSAIRSWLWISAALLALAAGAWWGWKRVRRAGPDLQGLGPEAEWEALRSRLPEHLRWGRDLTPHEASKVVCAYLLKAQKQLTATELVDSGISSKEVTKAEDQLASAIEAMTALANALAHYRYAPPGSPPHMSGQDVQQWRSWANRVVKGTQVAQRFRV